MTEDMTRGQALVRAASGLIGVPFQLHGRDPVEGLDCIGLVACCLEKIGECPAVPEGYSLRNSSLIPWIGCAQKSGLEKADGPAQAGDIVLTKPGPGQRHLMIAANEREAIHAHAGLRRVVRQPFASDTKILAHWRLR